MADNFKRGKLADGTKLSTEGKGFPGVKSGTENNVGGKTRVEVGEPGTKGKGSGRQITSSTASTNRYPAKGMNQKFDKYGDAKNGPYAGPGR